MMPPVSTDTSAEAAIFSVALFSSIVWTAKTSADWDNQYQARLDDYVKATDQYYQTLRDLEKQRYEFDRRLADILRKEGRNRTVARLTVDVFDGKAAQARKFLNLYEWMETNPDAVVNLQTALPGITLDPRIIMKNSDLEEALRIAKKGDAHKLNHYIQEHGLRDKLSSME